jgi:hypothetical protein
LKNVNVCENSAIIIEKKDDASELIKEVENIDDTESIRTVLVCADYDKECIERYQINITWNVKQLTDFLKEQFKLDGEWRLKNLFT